MSPSPRQDATERPLTGGIVPKTGQKTPSPREDATEMPVGGVGLLGESHEPEPEGHSLCPQWNVGWHFGNYC